jgi:hypothetical protein
VSLAGRARGEAAWPGGLSFPALLEGLANCWISRHLGRFVYRNPQMHCPTFPIRPTLRLSASSGVIRRG